MKGSDVVLIVLTFILGLFAGFYFYVHYYAPQERTLADSETASWSMNVREVGACQSSASCVQFQITDDGGYSFQHNETEPLERGHLSRGDRSDARALALGADWLLTEANQQCDTTDIYWYLFDVMTDDGRFQVGLCAALFDDSTPENVVHYFLEKTTATTQRATGGADAASESFFDEGSWLNRTFVSPVQFWVYGLNYPGDNDFQEE